MYAAANTLYSYVCVLPSIMAGVRAVPRLERDAWDRERKGWLQELRLSGAEEIWRGGGPRQVEGEGPPGQLGLQGRDLLEEHGWAHGPLGTPAHPVVLAMGPRHCLTSPSPPESLCGLHGRHPEPAGQGPLQLLYQGVPLPARADGECCPRTETWASLASSCLSTPCLS